MNKLTNIGFKDETFISVGGNYYVSNYGRIYNSKSKMITLKPNGNDKYYRVKIDGRKYRIHRLVAKNFVPNPENKPFVDHLDGDRYNNRADNLEWVTLLENNRRQREKERHFKSLTETDKQKIIKDSKRKTIQELALEYNITVPNIKEIINKRQ